MRRTQQITLSVGLIVVAVAIVLLQPGSEGANTAEEGGHDMSTMATGGGELMPVVLDAAAARRIGVALAVVEHRELPVFLSTVGTVTYDETSLATVSPKIDGWVEKLHIDFTGAPVRVGEPLMDVYSPALVTAQEELLLALRLVRSAESERGRRNGEELLAAARRRLAYWDIPEDQVRRVEESGEPQRTLTFRSPASGIVVEKNVVTGDRIMPGMTVYRIADLSRVWLEAEVFEKDLSLISLGQNAQVSFEAYPGVSHQARVTYVHPTVSVQSRTARVRLELPNPSFALKPGMYAQVELEAPPLPATLVVPRSAVIATGERALVFVEAADGALLPREVQPGRTEGRFMEILEGLTTGERVVSSAAFLVDAESNLGTMTGDPGEPPEEEVDHSQMDMGEVEIVPDTASGSDASGHDERQG